MIKRIELTNFMSHEHTVIEPAAGLTVLVGPNNCGKSAVVAALQILCHNDNSTYVLRHGEKECSVKVETDDGHTIQWRRKNSPSYRIDGQLFDRLGRGTVPEELHRVLRLPRVDGSDDADFDVHFGAQKSPIFLLGSSPANAARFFASSSDAIQLVQIQKRHKDKLTERQRQKNQLDAESKQLNSELESLQTAPDLDRRIKSLQELHQELQHIADRLADAEKTQAKLASQQGEITRHLAASSSLNPLTSPPDLSPTEPLASHIHGLFHAHNCVALAAANVAASAPLAAPPEMFDVASLQATVVNLRSVEQLAAQNQAVTQALRLLEIAPPLVDVSPLAALASQIDLHRQILIANNERLQSLRPLQTAPELADTSSLRRILQDLKNAQASVVTADARCRAASELKPPPTLSNEADLGTCVVSLLQSLAQFTHWTDIVAAVGSLPISPDIRDVTPLAKMAEDIQSAAEQVALRAAALKLAEDQLFAAIAQVREFALVEKCPTCGGPLNSDRLLSGALAGCGGHDHD